MALLLLEGQVAVQVLVAQATALPSRALLLVANGAWFLLLAVVRLVTVTVAIVDVDVGVVFGHGQLGVGGQQQWRVRLGRVVAVIGATHQHLSQFSECTVNQIIRIKAKSSKYRQRLSSA